MLSLQVPPTVDTPGWVADAIKFAAIFFFIGLPILRSIRESLQKRAQSGGDEKKRDVSERTREGRQAWEDLMRGAERVEPADTAPPAAAEPPPLSSPPPLPAGAKVESRTAAPARGLGDDFGSSTVLTSNDSEQDAPDEEEAAERVLEKRAGESLEQAIDRSGPREDLGPAFERPSGPLRGVDRSKSLDGRGTTEKDRDAVASAKPVQRRVARSKWRRAMVMNEVLGAPVCERGPSDRSRPAGLRP